MQPIKAPARQYTGATADHPKLAGVLPGLCVTEIVSWGVLYYAFPVLAPTITAQSGWASTSTTAAFSAALVVSAGVGIPVGRLLDRRGPRAVMTGGSVLAVAAIGLIAWSPSLPVFVAGWLLAGVAMAGALYQPAFAAVTGWFGARRLRALTTVTLVGGLASTAFAPMTNALEAGLTSWRQVYLVLGAGLAVITIPIHAIVLRRPWPTRVGHHRTPDGRARTVTRSRQFVLLATGMALAAVAMYATLINIIPLLTSNGVKPRAAAWLLGLGGIGQVAGRLLYGPILNRLSLRIRTLVSYSLVAASTGALAVVTGPIAAFVGLVLVAGLGRGIATLLQATAVPDRWGTLGYGRLSGLLGAPVMIAGAIAPWIGAWLAHLLDSYQAMFLTLTAAATIGTVLLAASSPPGRLNQRADRQVDQQGLP